MTTMRRTTAMSLYLSGDLPGGRVDGYSHFWLKYVNGFDPNVHCARCLRGQYSKRVSKDSLLNRPIVLNEMARFDYVYLCGVAKPYVWENNLHLAARHAPGARALVESYNGIRAVIRNAELLEIPALAEGFAGKPKAFTTCRNWQFGVAYYGVSQP